jgi:SAM-dependent methyltransferase
MPEVDENLANWSAGWDWSQAGDEWSAWWGGTPALWHGALLPRIHAFVPAATILEIAPGYGRWTQYLKDLAERLVIVDLTERCIEGCRQRFADATNIEYHVNDGRSLDMVEDNSIDFAFSFDSLVHAEADVLAAYLAQLARKLKPNGVGFIHHSNIGAYGPLTTLAHRTPGRAVGPLVRRPLRAGGPRVCVPGEDQLGAWALSDRRAVDVHPPWLSVGAFAGGRVERRLRGRGEADGAALRGDRIPGGKPHTGMTAWRHA